MKKKKMKFKKGIASFYIIAFSTLILVVIATGFAAIIVSEIERTSNDELAQSAYDSALAGVEDAKLAFYAYQNCKNNGGEGCTDTITTMEEETSCDKVAKILGRIGEGEEGEVLVQESSSIGNNMLQAYTCVKMSGITSNYLGTLTSGNSSRVIHPRFDVEGDATGIEGGVKAADIKQIKISWYSDANMGDSALNFNNFNNGQVTFPSVGVSGTTTPTPPVISVGLVQTAGTFTMDDFTTTRGNETDRGLVYLVPAESGTELEEGSNYLPRGNGEIEANALLKSNDKTRENLPYVVYCDESGDYACSAVINLPEAINGGRNDDTFAIAISLPYGRPDTDFMVEFFCGEGRVCSEIENEEEVEAEGSELAKLVWVQVDVDSTGRANDLYRRVEARLEDGSAFSVGGSGALEILGGDSDSISKNFYTTCEHNFIESSNCQ